MPSNISQARTLRHKQTEAERRLWAALKNTQLRGYKFRRQHPIGPYIADFACLELALVIEADGSQHAESEKDVIRTAWLKKSGWHVLRFWNYDILTNTEGVLETIYAVVVERESRLLR